MLTLLKFPLHLCLSVSAPHFFLDVNKATVSHQSPQLAHASPPRSEDCDMSDRADFTSPVFKFSRENSSSPGQSSHGRESQIISTISVRKAQHSVFLRPSPKNTVSLGVCNPNLNAHESDCHDDWFITVASVEAADSQVFFGRPSTSSLI